MAAKKATEKNDDLFTISDITQAGKKIRYVKHKYKFAPGIQPTQKLIDGAKLARSIIEKLTCQGCDIEVEEIAGPPIKISSRGDMPR